MPIGFQGSETSSVEVTFYRQSGDPVGKFFGDNTKISITGKTPQDEEHAIVGLQTNKMTGPSAGTWTLSLKPSAVAEDLFKTLNDDDWVDISINRHGRKWHVVRGLIDDVRNTTAVAGSGATTRTYTIIGRDFTKVLEQTPMYQDLYARSAKSLAAFLPNVIFNTLADSALDGVASMVEKSIRGYLQADNNSGGRTVWPMPTGMPEVKETFIDTVKFWTKGYLNDPARMLGSNHWASAQGMLWPWVVERSDPMMTDLWTDIIPKGTSDRDVFNAEDIEGGLPVTGSEMAIIVRDKPFPRTDTRLNGPWFTKLATFKVPRQQIISSDIGRTGYERFNAFFLASIITGQQEKSTDTLFLLAPTWSTGDIDRHGIRRFDMNTNWFPNYSKAKTPDAFNEFIVKYRQFTRDWHAINPYLLNGNIGLAIGRPDIKVGHKLRIPGEENDQTQETYYIEGVSHDWRYTSGTKTNLMVTRGWIGTDNDLLTVMDRIAETYEDAVPIRATTEST